MPKDQKDIRTGDAAESGAQNGSFGAVPVLPGASQAAHVTISGGLLAGPDVVRVQDNEMTAPEKLDVGARVELQDGTQAEVVKVRGKRLSEYGILEGGVEVKLHDGTFTSKPSRDIARVISGPAQT
jgi:hypothetical protein